MCASLACSHFVALGFGLHQMCGEQKKKRSAVATPVAAAAAVDVAGAVGPAVAVLWLWP